MINLGVVGYGYWGPNMVRNFMETPGSKVKAISDLIPSRLEKAQNRYPGINVSTNYEDLVADPGIDAVVISTPVSTHFEIAMKALKEGKHILVEKPMTISSDQAKRLIDEADKRKLVLMVDHTFIFTSAVQKMRNLISSNELGDIYYYDSTRVNLGLFQHDVNVIWDLAVHDLSIMDFIIPEKPISVSAIGLSHVTNQPVNIAYLTLFFSGNIIGQINVNWLAPVKIRRTLIGGSQKMIVYDDLEPSEKIKIYDKGITVGDNNPDNIYQILINYRTGDMWAPKLDGAEALKIEALHFIECIEKGSQPETNGESGLRIVRMLEAATESLSRNGKPVNL